MPTSPDKKHAHMYTYASGKLQKKKNYKKKTDESSDNSNSSADNIFRPVKIV
jgi:hypothetical protein